MPEFIKVAASKGKSLLMEVLRVNDLFGICCADVNDSFTPFERVVSLCCFVSMQILTVSFVADLALSSAAECACISGEPVGVPAFNNCTIVGETVFSLPANDSSWREEWFDYEHAGLPRQCVEPNATSSGNETVFCDPVYACCYAYLDAIVKEGEELSTYPQTGINPCPMDPVLETIFASIFSTFLSLALFKPLVKCILTKETRMFNWIAYLLVIFQIMLAVAEFTSYISRANQMYVRDAETKTLDVIAYSILMGLCVWSPVSVIVTKFVCLCCCACCNFICCCCGEQKGDSEDESKDAEQELLKKEENKEAGYDAMA